MATKAITTTDHDEIREWVEDHGGTPAVAKEMGKDQAGILYVDFHSPNAKEKLEDITWDEFFSMFDKNHLAFVYHESAGAEKDGTFFKFVERPADGDDMKNKANKRDAKDQADEKVGAKKDKEADEDEEDALASEADKAAMEGMGDDDEDRS